LIQQPKNENENENGSVLTFENENGSVLTFDTGAMRRLTTINASVGSELGQDGHDSAIPLGSVISED
jgi:hypothetical protein